jgi:hypothetical protein
MGGAEATRRDTMNAVVQVGYGQPDVLWGGTR